MKLIPFYQNLSDGKHLGIWHGRARLFSRDFLRVEWCLGRKSTNLHMEVSWFDGDSNRDMMLIFGLPWLFTIYLTLQDVMPSGKHERRVGINYHDKAFRVYTGGKAHEWNSKDPWWEHGITLIMPWEYWHLSTEIIALDGYVAWREDCRTYWRSLWDRATRNDRPSRIESGICATRSIAEQVHSREFDYRYVLKDGTAQNVKARCHIDRLTWGLRWFPFIKKSRTSMSCNFSAEVGEGTGSWKGGCTGCGMDLLPTETMEQCLRRMEATRKFER